MYSQARSIILIGGDKFTEFHSHDPAIPHEQL